MSTKEEILEALENGTLTYADLSQKIGVSAKTIGKIIGILADEGKVKKVKEDGRIYVELAKSKSKSKKTSKDEDEYEDEETSNHSKKKVSRKEKTWEVYLNRQFQFAKMGIANEIVESFARALSLNNSRYTYSTKESEDRIDIQVNVGTKGLN